MSSGPSSLAKGAPRTPTPAQQAGGEVATPPDSPAAPLDTLTRQDSATAPQRLQPQALPMPTLKKGSFPGDKASPPPLHNAKEYENGWRSRWASAVRSAGLAPTLLVPPKVRSKSAFLQNRLRAVVYSWSNTFFARLTTQAHGTFGDFGHLLGEDGEMYGAKVLRTNPQRKLADSKLFDPEAALRIERRREAVLRARPTPPGAPRYKPRTEEELQRAALHQRKTSVTRVSTRLEAQTEVDFLIRFYDSRVELLEDPVSGKLVIKMPFAPLTLKKEMDTADHKLLVRSAMRQIAQQLSTMAAAGYAHFDLKPENIFVSGDGKILAADMGKVNEVDQPTIGTINYAAPEVVNLAATTSALVDVWSLALTLADALVPFTTDAESASIFKPDNDWGMLSEHEAFEQWRQGFLVDGHFDYAEMLKDIHSGSPFSAYFRKLDSADSDLCQFMLRRMLVPAAERASAAEVMAEATRLQPPDSAEEAVVQAKTCWYLDNGPRTQAARLALKMRLREEVYGRAICLAGAHVPIWSTAFDPAGLRGASAAKSVIHGAPPPIWAWREQFCTAGEFDMDRLVTAPSTHAEAANTASVSTSPPNPERFATAAKRGDMTTFFQELYKVNPDICTLLLTRVFVENSTVKIQDIQNMHELMYNSETDVDLLADQLQSMHLDASF